MQLQNNSSIPAWPLLNGSLNYFTSISLIQGIIMLAVYAYILIFNRNPVIDLIGVCFNIVIFVDMLNKGGSELDILVLILISLALVLKLLKDINYE